MSKKKITIILLVVIGIIIISSSVVFTNGTNSNSSQYAPSQSQDLPDGDIPDCESLNLFETDFGDFIMGIPKDFTINGNYSSEEYGTAYSSDFEFTLANVDSEKYNESLNVIYYSPKSKGNGMNVIDNVTNHLNQLYQNTTEVNQENGSYIFTYVDSEWEPTTKYMVAKVFDNSKYVNNTKDNNQTKPIKEAVIIVYGDKDLETMKNMISTTRFKWELYL